MTIGTAPPVLGAQPATDVQSGQTGQHQVEDDRVRWVGERPLQRRRAVGDHLDGEPVPLQVAADDVADGLVVVDHQHPAHARRVGPARPRPPGRGAASESRKGRPRVRTVTVRPCPLRSTPCCRAWTRPQRCPGCSAGCRPATGPWSRTTARPTARPRSPDRWARWWSTVPQRGFGAAVHAGLLACTSDVVCVLDADGSLDPAELPAVAAPVLRGQADLVLGRRRPTSRGAWPWHGRVGNALLARRLHRHTGTRLHDLGPMRAFRRRGAARPAGAGPPLRLPAGGGVARGRRRLADHRGGRRRTVRAPRAPGPRSPARCAAPPARSGTWPRCCPGDGPAPRSWPRRRSRAG